MGWGEHTNEKVKKEITGKIYNGFFEGMRAGHRNRTQYARSSCPDSRLIAYE
jgi:hypothetical protein